jgi:hypothetical protein
LDKKIIKFKIPKFVKLSDCACAGWSGSDPSWSAAVPLPEPAGDQPIHSTSVLFTCWPLRS